MSVHIRELQSELSRELGRVVVGAEAPIRALIIALIARGHVLVQGVPGLGKTLLAKTLARALGGEFKRIQGTPDLMPSDIIGVHVFDEARARVSCSAPDRCLPTSCWWMRSIVQDLRRSRRCSRRWRSAR